MTGTTLSESAANSKRRLWSPALPEGASRAIMIILSVQAIIRGTDYLLGDKDSTTQSLTIAEQAMPLQIWGIIFSLGGLMALVGVLRRNSRTIASASAWLTAAYGALAWAMCLKVIERATSWHDFWETFEDGSFSIGWLSRLAVAFPIDGWRTPTTFIAAAAIWAAIGWGVTIKHTAWEVNRSGSNSRADP